jgi:signal transduction histidine kinase
MKSSTIYKSFPLYGNGSDLGYVQIGYSLKNLQSQLYLSTYRMLGIEVGVFFLILLAAWSITSALLEPLSAMKNASNKIAAGDFSIRTPVVTHDIIGELGTALNNMAERLGDLTRNMNDKIVLATGNLSESNDALRKKTIELEASNRKLMELDTLKSDFVTMVSHDLKTPLTSIIGFAKTLLTLNVTPEQRSKYLTIIETEGKRLAQLIGEYLDISKIESGNFTVKKEPVDPAALVREITESTAIHAPSKSIVVTIAKAIPLILGDANQLKRVVINLLDNALRYNVPDKSICVSVDNKNDHVIVSVKDNGPGIRPEEQNLIFDKFFRSSDAVNERTSGNGLGLAIAKGIVNAHDGALWVESEPGKGATFSFNLPAAVSPQEKA